MAQRKSMEAISQTERDSRTREIMEWQRTLSVNSVVTVMEDWPISISQEFHFDVEDVKDVLGLGPRSLTVSTTVVVGETF
jgi:hypothetical protein